MRGRQEPFVLAISPSPRGFAFVLFQGSYRPFDWGVKEIRGSKKNVRSILAIRKLVGEYRPAGLVIEDTTMRTKRRFRIRSLLRSVEKLATRQGVNVRRLTKKHVQAAFAEEYVRKRPTIAEVIARRIPAFAHRLPPPRKIWQSKHPRQSLFDAAALGATYDAITPYTRTAVMTRSRLLAGIHTFKERHDG